MITKLFEFYEKKKGYSTAKASLLIAMELAASYAIISLIFQFVYTILLSSSVYLDSTLTSCVFALITAIVIDGGAINISKIINGKNDNKQEDNNNINNNNINND